MKTKLLGAAALIGLAGLPFVSHAADHIDAPGAAAEPTADITDVFAWMSADAKKLNLIMNVHHMAGKKAEFSDAVQYVMHVNSSAAFGDEQTETQVICQFYAKDALECWAGGEYVTGDPSDPKGIKSASGKLRVFAGRRDDPFFFELVGFKETVKMTVAAAGGLTFDAEGCPALDTPTSTALVAQLQHGKSGAAASNTFAGSSVLSIAVELDKGVVDEGGPVLGVWASTHAVSK